MDFQFPSGAEQAISFGIGAQTARPRFFSIPLRGRAVPAPVLVLLSLSMNTLSRVCCCLSMLLAAASLVTQAAPSDSSIVPPAARRHWTADNGNGTYSNPLFYEEFEDPDIIRVGEDYYLAGTTMHMNPAGSNHAFKRPW